MIKRLSNDKDKVQPYNKTNYRTKRRNDIVCYTYSIRE